jgi:serine/threonine protein kinase
MRLFPAYHTYFLVMEFCEGVNLRDLLRRTGPLPESQVRALLGQLASALDYIHGRGVVHRDLKPANVMLTREGQIKLTDFGLAAPTIGLDDEARTRVDAVIGTPAYMAPEQLSGQRCDHRADVYAFGCLAFELLTGRHLFTATNFREMEQQKLALRLPPAERIGNGISTELAAFLEQALQVVPERRPGSLRPLVAWASRFEPSAPGVTVDLNPTLTATQIEPVPSVGSDSPDTKTGLSS